jgi:hypothetical protein
VARIPPVSNAVKDIQVSNTEVAAEKFFARLGQLSTGTVRPLALYGHTGVPLSQPAEPDGEEAATHHTGR